MALTRGDYEIWLTLKAEGLIPANPALLEIGQANYYGDVPVERLAKDCAVAGFTDAFAAARAFYKMIFAPKVTIAIDLHGQPSAYKRDLNKPLPDPIDMLDVGNRCLEPVSTRNYFDIVINTGTTEHVFDQRQVFETIHDACRVNGLMFHGVPWKGWMDHGFVAYQPTFFTDLAAANGYEPIVFSGFQLGGDWLHGFKSLAEIHEMERAGKIPKETMLYVVMRKKVDGPFVVPMQGAYSERLTDAEKSDWHTMR